MNMVRREGALTVFFVTQLVGLTLLQKFGIPAGDLAVALALPLMWIGVALLFVQGIVTLDPTRLILFSAFAAIATFSQATLKEFSMPSMLLVFGIYALMIFKVEVSGQFYLRLMKYFITSALLATPLMAYEWAMQFLVHPGQWLNIEPYVPKQYITAGYSYVRATAGGSPWIKPNAGVFLETSILAQYLGLAIVIELTYFRRWLVVLLLGSALLSTLSGTGLLLLFLTAPVLLRGMPGRYTWGASLAVLLLIVAMPLFDGLGLFDRLTEFQTENTSGYGRFVAPILLLLEYVGRPDVWLSGIGAGNSTEVNTMLLPVVKLTLEYGMVAAIIFGSLMLFSLCKGAHRGVIPLALLIFFNLLGGGLAVPFYGLITILLGTLIKVTPISSSEPEPAADAAFRPPATAATLPTP